MKIKFKNILKKLKKKTAVHKLTREDVQSRNDENRIVVYQNLFTYSGGIFFLILVVLINIFWKMSEFSSDYVITIWSLNENLTKDQNMIYLYIYSAVSILAIIFIFVRTLIVVGGIIKYNKKMHNVLLTRLLQAPINLFHDVVPRAQVLNRLSKDLDNSVKFFWTFNSTFRLFFQLLSCVFVSILFNWYSIFFFPIMVLIDYNIFKFYIKGGRDLNHLEGGTRSPIISGFSETSNGITSIRGFNFQDNFRKKYHSRLDDFYKVLIYQNGCTSWFALNIDLVSFCLLFIVLAFSIIFKNYISPDAIGLLLTYTLKLIDFTYNFFEQYTLFERLLASIERCDAFTQIVQENAFVQKGDENLRKTNFPQNGRLTFINYSAKYRPDTELALKNLNLDINPHEKIGVVGRTGSGKSTLCLCVFRILEPYTGKILIDDVDITKIGLKFLREIITVIPQDPTLIEGTLKQNLDPIDKFTDEEIEEQMKEIGLEYMLSKKNGLKYRVSEGGLNLSVGERQLICIARAILRRSKIIIMDEATSSIDYKTETLIQQSLEKSLRDSTVITIAHRIKTIINYDRIIVLQRGELIEQGKPSALINSRKGTFYDLYMQSNL
jgi:ABC-type multidrug transport system fused ATPase/permease subunit